MINFVYLFLERSSSLILSLLSAVLIARYMGPSESGFFQTCISITFLFKYLCTFGAQHVIAKEAALSTSCDLIIKPALFLYNIGFIIYIFFVYTFLYFFGYDSKYFLLLTILNVGVFFERSLIFQSIGHGLGEYKNYSLSTLFSCAVSFIYLIYSVLNGFTVIEVSFYYIIQTFLVYILSKLHVNSKSSFFDEVVVGQSLVLLKKSYPLLLSGALYTVYMRLDLIVVERMLGKESAGLYSAATKLVMPFAFLGTIAAQLYFKRIVHLWHDRDVFDIFLIKFLAKTNYLALFLFTVYVFYSKDLVFMLYGKDFKAAAEVLEISALVFFVIFSSAVFSRVLVAANFYKLELYKTGIAALTSVSLLMYLVPNFGLNGAAMAVVFSFVLSDLLLYLLFKETRFIFFLYLKSFLWWRYV